MLVSDRHCKAQADRCRAATLIVAIIGVHTTCFLFVVRSGLLEQASLRGCKHSETVITSCQQTPPQSNHPLPTAAKRRYWMGRTHQSATNTQTTAYLPSEQAFLSKRLRGIFCGDSCKDSKCCRHTRSTPGGGEPQICTRGMLASRSVNMVRHPQGSYIALPLAVSGVATPENKVTPWSCHP